MKEITLTKGKLAVVDDDEFEFITQWKWSFDGSYAVRGHYLGRKNGKDKYKKIYLHRVLNKTPKGLETDHINKDKLDNRKENLRSVTKSQNGRNRDAYKNNKTKVCGVGWYDKIKKYRASIVFDKKRIHLGYFININDAASARRTAEKLYGV